MDSSASSSSAGDAAAEANSYDWIIGVVLCFMGSVLSNMGVNFQKKCHMVLADKAKAAAAAAAASGRPSNLPKPKVVMQPLWIGGLVGIALGSAMDLISFGFAPLSLLAPLGAMVRPVGWIRPWKPTCAPCAECVACVPISGLMTRRCFDILRCARATDTGRERTHGTRDSKGEPHAG